MEQMPYYNQENILSTMQQMAEQSTDPMKRMLAQMALTKMQESKQSQSVKPLVQSNSNAKMVQDIQRLVQMNREMILSFRTMEARLLQVQERNAIAAASLGACPCWGLDYHCSTCGGQGIPGSMEVNTAHFTKLILPFFQKIMQPVEEEPVQE